MQDTVQKKKIKVFLSFKFLFGLKSKLRVQISPVFNFIFPVTTCQTKAIEMAYFS